MQGLFHFFMFLYQILPGPNMSTWQEFPTGHLGAPSLSGVSVEIPGHKKPKKEEARPSGHHPGSPLPGFHWTFPGWLCSFCAPRPAYPGSKGKPMGTRPPWGPAYGPLPSSSLPVDSVGGHGRGALFLGQPSRGTACKVGGKYPPLTEPSKVRPAPVKAGLPLFPHPSLGPRVSPTLALGVTREAPLGYAETRLFGFRWPQRTT